MNINTSLSGIRNAFVRQDVAANNIANINTKNYKQINVVNEEQKNGGVKATFNKSKAAPTHNKNNVNLAQQMVSQMNNVNQEKANVKVVRAQNEMIGSLIDLKA